MLGLPRYLETPRARTRPLQPKRLLVVALVGTALLFLVLTDAAWAQERGSTPQYPTPQLVAPSSGATISNPDSLQFRWRVEERVDGDGIDGYRRLYHRLVVTPDSEGQAVGTDSAANSVRVVKTYPEWTDDASSQEEASSTGPYPTVGDWFSAAQDQASAPRRDNTREARLSHPTVGDWFPEDTEKASLPNGTYSWEVHLVGATPEGEEILASSSASLFTVKLAENGRDEETRSASVVREVRLDFFDLRLRGPAVEARLVRNPSSGGDHVLRQIELLRSQYPITLQWDRAELTDSFPDRQVRLVDEKTGGELLDADMKASSTTEVASADVTTLEVRSSQVAAAQPPDHVTLTLMPKVGAFLSGVSSFEDVSGEAGAALGGEQSVFTWGGSAAFGARDGTMNLRLTGLGTSSSLVSTTEGVESDARIGRDRLLMLTGDLVLRPIPRFVVQPYGIGGLGARRLSVQQLEESGPGPEWDLTAQVGVGLDVRVGNVTVGLEVMDYLTGFDGPDGDLQHDAFLFLALGVPIF